jgi:hypothetical protein
MKNKLLLLVGASVLALVSGATCGQPLMLSDAQMDCVAAGAVGSATGLAVALGNLEAQTVTLALSSADSGHGTALATGLSAASAASLLSPAAATSRAAATARAP